MKKFKFKRNQEEMVLVLHSELDDVTKQVLEALIDRTLDVFEKSDRPVNGLLSEYNKGNYVFCTIIKPDAIYVEYIHKNDLPKAPEYIKEFIKEQMTADPFYSDVSLFEGSTRELPWSK